MWASAASFLQIFVFFRKLHSCINSSTGGFLILAFQAGIAPKEKNPTERKFNLPKNEDK